MLQKEDVIGGSPISLKVSRGCGLSSWILYWILFYNLNKSLKDSLEISMSHSFVGDLLFW